MKIKFAKFLQSLKQPFQQGLSRLAIVKALIVSLLISVLPIFGVTTALLAAAAVKLKLNLPVMLVVSYLATPLQYLLFIPFVHFGEILFNTSHTLLSVTEIKNAFDQSFWSTLKDLLFEIICGVTAWLMIALPISLLALFLSKKLIKPTKIKDETN